jgi:hypothetical protein
MTRPHLAALEASLELAANTAGDPASLIYARLFDLHPGIEAEFWRDTSGRIRGEMLARSFEMIQDFAAPHAADGGGWSGSFLGTEAVTHDAYGIPRAVFADFLPIIATVIRDACGPGFTPDMAAAWETVLARADAVLAALPGSSGEARVIDAESILPPLDERGAFFPMR